MKPNHQDEEEFFSRRDLKGSAWLHSVVGGTGDTVILGGTDAGVTAHCAAALPVSHGIGEAATSVRDFVVQLVTDPSCCVPPRLQQTFTSVQL